MNQGPRGQQHPQRSPLAWSCRRSLWSALLPNFLRLCLRGGRVPPTAGAREGGRGGRGWRSFPARWDLPSLWLFRGPFRGNAPDVRFDFRWPLPGGMGLWPSLPRDFGEMLVPSFSGPWVRFPLLVVAFGVPKGRFSMVLGRSGGTRLRYFRRFYRRCPMVCPRLFAAKGDLEGLWRHMQDWHLCSGQAEMVALGLSGDLDGVVLFRCDGGGAAR